MTNPFIEETMKEFDEEFPKPIEIVVDVGGDSDTIDLRERFRELLLSRFQAYAEEVKKEIMTCQHLMSYPENYCNDCDSGECKVNDVLDTIKNLPILNLSE